MVLVIPDRFKSGYDTDFDKLHLKTTSQGQ